MEAKREITIEDIILEEAFMRKLKQWVLEAIEAKKQAERENHETDDYRTDSIYGNGRDHNGRAGAGI